MTIPNQTNMKTQNGNTTIVIILALAGLSCLLLSGLVRKWERLDGWRDAANLWKANSEANTEKAGQLKAGFDLALQGLARADHDREQWKKDRAAIIQENDIQLRKQGWAIWQLIGTNMIKLETTWPATNLWVVEIATHKSGDVEFQTIKRKLPGETIEAK